jgi:hypothetical protein
MVSQDENAAVQPHAQDLLTSRVPARIPSALLQINRYFRAKKFTHFGPSNISDLFDGLRGRADNESTV